MLSDNGAAMTGQNVGISGGYKEITRQICPISLLSCI
jgi:hypothetical protein